MTWTDEEIQDYEKIRDQRLGPLYAQAGIHVGEPEQRVRYLEERVLKLTTADHEAIMTLEKTEGKAAALEQLEAWTVEIFF